MTTMKVTSRDWQRRVTHRLSTAATPTSVKHPGAGMPVSGRDNQKRFNAIKTEKALFANQVNRDVTVLEPKHK